MAGHYIKGGILILTLICAALSDDSNNLASIPNNLSQNATQLNLSYHQIKLNGQDIQVLKNYKWLTELYLNKNNISDLPENAFSALPKLKILSLEDNVISRMMPTSFQGLSSLQELYLCHNKIEILPPDIFKNLTNLKKLTLCGNKLQAMKEDTLMPPNLEELDLRSNPWNCTSGFVHLLKLLQNHVKLELDLSTTICSSLCTPKVLAAASTTSSPTTKNGKLKDWVSTESTKSLNKSRYLDKDTHEAQPTGASWNFLIGVVVAALSTTFVTLCAVKFPAWYKYLFSYQHLRLREEEPEMFTPGQRTDLDIFSIQPTSNIDVLRNATLSYETMPKFTEDEDDDGFIEDKYIDAAEYKNNQES
ncbi:leucine-rich repeat-containing protein 19-like [Erpetoichthys calabaricus]|uniref:leucine-rich repeat-containing protein 19-like n=1 Tax=Erpetoichthys calabaricus TaxID=27687 RepID=UPI00223402AA|nr:leucine-rich repeat-containing protein 19-like [Erpetoichthys calabaricus]